MFPDLRRRSLRPNDALIWFLGRSTSGSQHVPPPFPGCRHFTHARNMGL